VEMLKDGTIVLGLLSPETLHKSMAHLIGEIGHSFRRICYISMTKPYGFVQKEAKAAGVAKESLFVIDCVSGDMGVSSDVSGCLFASGLEDLTNLNIDIKQTIDKERFDAVIIDNIAILALHNSIPSALKFLQNVVIKLRVSGVGVLLLATKGGEHGGFVKEAYMFVDEVVELG